MGVHDSEMGPADQATAESLLSAFRTIKSAEREKHANVLSYWLSIRGDKEFPLLHDLDPLAISDAGPCSVLLELIGGGQDAEIRHVGENLKQDVTAERIIDAPNPSILSSIAKKLPIVAISRDFLAFEDDFGAPGQPTRCWVTLLPLSSCGSWVDYVYALVSVEADRSGAAKPAKAAKAKEPPPEMAEPQPAPVEEVAPEIAEEVEASLEEAPIEALEEVEAAAPLEEADGVEVVEPVEAVEALESPEPDELSLEVEYPEPIAEPEAQSSAPGFAKLFEGVAGLVGFYGQSVKFDSSAQAEPTADGPEPAEPMAEHRPVDELGEEVAPEPAVEPDPEPTAEPATDVAPEPTSIPAPVAETATEGSLQSKLSEVRAKADEARMARLRATAALHEGLGAAYDFALDAESSPEEYLRLVETQGLKIQLRAPMAPVVKLAFDGLTDATTIAQLEAVLVWALKEELPRGTLAARIEEAGGLSELLNGAPQHS